MKLVKEIDYGFIFLVAGYSENDTPQYAYLMVDHENYLKFLKDAVNENIDISEYGIILESGEGLEPPQEIVKEIEGTFNVSHKYMEKIESYIKESI